MNLLTVKCCDVAYGSDQNMDYLHISQHSHTADLFNTHISHGLIPVITRPTRITHQTATLIDNIYIKVQGDTQIKSGIITTQISDHLPVFAFFGNNARNTPKQTKIQFRELNDRNIDKIKLRLSHYDWAPLLNINSNDGLTYFISTLTSIIDDIAPSKTKTISAKHSIREPWVTKGIMKS